VATVTGGNEPDPNGYLLRVDGVQSLALQPTDTSAIDLAAGVHTLRLTGVAEHCSVLPETPLDVALDPRDTLSVAFEVMCSATGIRIATTTTGLDLDPDGYRVDVDGTDRGSVPSNGTLLTLLAPGSHVIALTGLAPNCALEGPDTRSVIVVSQQIQLAEFVAVCSPKPTAPPPASRVLAFESTGDIFVSNMDGSHLVQLTSDGSPNSYNREVAWSPDGNRIAFSKSDGRWGAAIYVIDADGANARRLSPEGTYDATPAWSPDGRRIAFENRRDNQSGGHIFVMNADGTDRVQLTNNRQPNSSPAWSPDGSRIAYVTYREPAGDNKTDIFLMNADGTQREHLTSDGAGDTSPKWAPDGGHIVFVRAGEVLAVESNGTNPSRLTPPRSGAEWWGAPAWSSDGTLIAFNRSILLYVDEWGDPHTDTAIWVLRLADGTMTKLPLQVRRPGAPSWRP
jgi:dipeptidyl aminopeptidase/acylaminoacyl peptidase